VGCGLDEHRRRAGHGWHILGSAARPAHPIAHLSTHSDYQREVGFTASWDN
jgi:hypothetical protein